MKKSLIILIVISIFLMLFPPLIGDMSKKKASSLDVVEVNQLLSEIEASEAMAVSKSSGPYSFDYTILDTKENVVYSSTSSEADSIVKATKNRDTIRDIYIAGELKGWLIIHNKSNVLEEKVNQYYALMYVISYLAIILLWGGYTVWLYIFVIRPFDKMKEFASAVAAGDLDKPLEMDRKNIFGAFTESFDIMRDELAIAREREYQANVSKRELVAQLSHDIKTPVASIKAMSEVLEAKSQQSGDEFMGTKVKSIGAKADQIDALVNNLFASTLKELEQLEVNAIETESTAIKSLIENADYSSKVKYTEIPSCLIYMDKLRAGQVFTNVIFNSYKYADTDIALTTNMDEEYLYISLADRGGGVPEDELPFIMDKFRRGSNAEGVEGTGLGLNISRNLMQDMQGLIVCENEDGGFKVTLGFRLA
ncbi:His Kinase A (phospho-acceptor) domain-containing protein [Lachnospiraceae bacterium NE2001]|nr:His Kinase A (phospho-acceptor) domain-containing protein [Lachnospiraceae bacterium NE2001]